MNLNFPVFAAPLAGITDRPFRTIMRKCAPDAPMLTEMISCHSLVENCRARKTNCARNYDNYAEEGLVGAQIFGAEPKIMADAARILEQSGASWIDINMGCPVPKVATRAGAGAFLMRDHRLAGEIVRSVVSAVKIPVSIKTRLGWDSEHLDSADLVRIAAAGGAKFATIHGRTRAQGYAGRADWDQIKNVKSKMKNVIPVIFNGDIKTTDDVETVRNMGADGAMIGRALLGHPELLGILASGAMRLAPRDLILEHLDLTLSYYGVRAGVPLFRKHAAWYSDGMPGAAEFRRHINQVSDPAEMRRIITQFFKL